MNILFSSLAGHDKTESHHYVRVLKRLGHNVFRFSTPSSRHESDGSLWVEPGYSPEIEIDRLIELAGFDPDLFLYIEPFGLIPRGMERVKFPTVAVICDVHQDLPSRQKLSRFFDFVFCYHRNYIGKFNEHPSDHRFWSPYAVDTSVFRPAPTERDIDVAFIGMLFHTGRAEVIRKLSKHYAMNENRFYLQSEIPEVYGRAKIVLNMPLGDDLNFRTFEAMAAGALLLTRRVNNGQEVLFREDQHFVAYSDEDELLKKVDYYLSHPADRIAIAAAGFEEIQVHHRLDQRVEDLLTKVSTNKALVAPIRSMSASQVDRQYAWLYEYSGMVEPGLRLVVQAREAGRSWLPLLPAGMRSILRKLRH